MTDAIFPPRTSSTGLVCANATVTNDYMLKWFGYEAEIDGGGWATLNATKPKESVSLAWSTSTTPTLVRTRWKSDAQLQVWIPGGECVSVIVYSV